MTYHVAGQARRTSKWVFTVLARPEPASPGRRRPVCGLGRRRQRRFRTGPGPAPESATPDRRGQPVPARPAGDSPVSARMRSPAAARIRAPWRALAMSAGQGQPPVSFTGSFTSSPAGEAGGVL
jgi:hypothetical protein